MNDFLQQPTPEEAIIRKIVLLHGEKIILDLHLAEFYGVETRALKQAVKRNIERFPGDFMFELTDEDIDWVVSQNVIPHKKFLGGAKPFAFTEPGVAMLSSVLRSKTAIEMNVLIIRAFVTLRKVALDYKEIMQVLNNMKDKYDHQFLEIYAALEQLVNPPNPPRTRIGFK